MNFKNIIPFGTVTVKRLDQTEKQQEESHHEKTIYCLPYDDLCGWTD